MHSDPQRDGPYETIRFLLVGRSPAVAFGWRNSPTEGYPRPSVWAAVGPTDDSWTEIAEDREFFGGPNIVSFGGTSSGPDGYFIAGTWTSATGPIVASVWSSPDGLTWSHDFTDAAFAGRPGEVPFAEGIADGPTGVLMVGTADAPTHTEPGATRGVLWFAPAGRNWTRLDVAPSGVAVASRFDAVAATDGGWIVGGMSDGRDAGRPLVWFVPGADREPRPEPLDGGIPGASISSVAVDSTRVVAGGVVGQRIEIWTAPLHDGIPGRWSVLTAPPVNVPYLQKIVLSVSPSYIAADVIGRSATEIWTAPLQSGP